MIISASRRTDIPAFYSDWFSNRVQSGYLLVRNPFNHNQIKRVSLLPEDVGAIVFWTRNAEKIIKFFPLFDEMRYAYYFQYTITGYSRVLEKSVPRPSVAIDTFKKVSDLLGPDRVIWRYDPILLSNVTDVSEHKRLFEKIAALLEGKTRRVVISFADLYKKSEKNLRLIEGLKYYDVTTESSVLLELVEFMAQAAHAHGLEIESCSEKLDLSQYGIENGKCIDDALLKAVFGIKIDGKKDQGQREECGCIKSIDIGTYNTCLHGCSYCYATDNKNVAKKNSTLHDFTSPFLVGPSFDHSQEQENQTSLFDQGRKGSEGSE